MRKAQRARHRHGLEVAAGLLLTIAGAASGGARAATDSGLWSVALAGSNRTCTVRLDFDAAGAAGALAIPAGCRKALPVFRQIASWSVGGDGQITFSDGRGGAVLVFDRQAEGGWRAADGAGRELTLAPVSGAVDGLTQAGTDGPVALDTAPEPAEGPIVQLATKSTRGSGAASATDTKAAAGRYAVMRGDRDTGCMVTLDAGSSGPKGGYRARLAPACRDQGIIIFDPLGWQVKDADLVLTARKGHSISLEKDPNGIWVKTPADAKSLGLKPL